ncbi:ABC transporter permease subunit [Streptomyces tubbatahanensis]|uniref:ABC transporter permease subunit n=1 Tax=Streptomyces tubbatahanensis TaxID=2923272 RepID=A0ABY3XLE3_9ACTN|nr:ABC transporter permease subunit [Streptomyces tubbatahanensis]UNS95282.1 ABC transporter permease subunit [Streptomyces tubbatahanensis]
MPVLVALAGPLLPLSAAPGGTPSAPPGPGHLLGTDSLGRDVLALVSRGGLSVLGMTAATLVLAYAAGVPSGLLAAHGRRWVDETVMRGLDLLLAFPSLLLLMTLAATGHRGTGTLVAAAALVQVPAVARLVRATALAPGCRTAVEALRLQGMPEWRVQCGYVARSVRGPLVTDAGSRFGLVLYLLASANFLGLGLPADSPDWAVVIERNTDALFLQPAAVLVPAGLLMALCVGANLTADRFLARHEGRSR